MYSKVEISNIVFRGVEVKKYEIRLKSENLQPCFNYSIHICCKIDLIFSYIGTRQTTEDGPPSTPEHLLKAGD